MYTKHSRKGCLIPPPNLGNGAKSQGVSTTRQKP
nr:MAG TPA: hypothetical protein [Caudoviricetes sp.]DAP13629.1 MAG TPA: hypothetical protein [Caudoviricetes sp.]